MKKTKILDYPFTIHHLPLEDGDDILIEFPDLPGCMSDGDTPEEAIENGPTLLRDGYRLQRHQGVKSLSRVNCDNKVENGSACS